jgi:hypothetical protein
VVLGLSVTLAKGQLQGSVPATTGYGGFAGAVGILGGFVGVVALFVERLQGVFGLVVDGVVALVLLAGGVVWVVQLKGVSCNDWLEIINNVILNCGARPDKAAGDGYYTNYCLNLAETAGLKVQSLPGAEENRLAQRCVEARAVYVFMFGAGLVGLAAVGVGFGWVRRRKSYAV